MAFSTFKFYKLIRYSPTKVAKRYVATLSAVAGKGYTSGVGETVDFTIVSNPEFAARPKPPGFGKTLPVADDITVVRVPAGYDAVVSPAAASPTLKNFNMRIYTSGGTEISTADYPAGLAGGDVVFDVLIPSKFA